VPIDGTPHLPEVVDHLVEQADAWRRWLLDPVS